MKIFSTKNLKVKDIFATQSIATFIFEGELSSLLFTNISVF